MRDRFDQQRARVADARRVEILGARCSTTGLRPRIEAHSPINSFTSSSIATEWMTVVRREPPRKLRVLPDQPQRLLEAADQRAGRDQLLVDLGLVVRIGDLRAARRPVSEAQSKAWS